MTGTTWIDPEISSLIEETIEDTRDKEIVYELLEWEQSRLANYNGTT